MRLLKPCCSSRRSDRGVSPFCCRCLRCCCPGGPCLGGCTAHEAPCHCIAAHAPCRCRSQTCSCADCQLHTYMTCCSMPVWMSGELTGTHVKNQPPPHRSTHWMVQACRTLSQSTETGSLPGRERWARGRQHASDQSCARSGVEGAPSSGLYCSNKISVHQLPDCSRPGLCTVAWRWLRVVCST